MKHLSGSSATSIGDSWKSMCGKCSRKMRILSTILLLCSVLRTGTSLQLLRLDVPSIADPRWDKVVLKCEYDLGGEDLYAVTWYKDGFQFFRYMPESQPSAREFPVTGVHVDLNRSDNKQVTLFGQNSLTRAGKVNLAGSYGCEVSSEAPSFQTIYGEANMSVAIPPKEPPSLHGLRPSYEAGETLFAECTSAPSYPPALLAFILNGKEVNKALTKELPGGSTSEESMVSSSRLRLTLRLERHHFPSGTLSLSCQSTLPGVAGTRPLERTETATLAANNQRLAQEPPRSDAGHQRPLLAGVVCCCVMAIARSASLW